MLEKLFMHVFDRKQWISGQLRQQVYSYEESLACNLAASGRELPSWLFDEDDFSISPKEEDDLANSSNMKVAELCDALIIPQEDDLANSSNYVPEIDPPVEYEGGSIIEQEDGRPELEAEAFTIGTCSGKTRNIQPETIPLSLAEHIQLSSSGLCNLASPGKYKSKSLPTGTGHFDFMKTGEALSSVSIPVPVTVPVNVNDRKKQPSESATSGSIPYQSGFPIGGLSTSGKSGNASTMTTPGDKEDLSSIIIIDDIVEVPQLPRVVDKSYEMSPYKDSDAEGDNGLDELEEDQTWRNKYIPSWAQKEYLEYYLHSRKYMYPELIFSGKCSFDMSKVLKPRNQP